MGDDFVLMVDLEVDAVRPGSAEFTLDGRGADGADYRLEMRLEMPMDVRTRRVLGELLAQSDFRLYRRVRVSLKPRREVGAKRG